MIVVEADAGEDWDSRIDWNALADRAVRAAIGSSRHGGLAGSALAVEISVKFPHDQEVKALNAA